MPRRRDENEPPKHRIQVLISRELFERLQASARQNNRSVNGEVVTAVQQYLHTRREADRD